MSPTNSKVRSVGAAPARAASAKETSDITIEAESSFVMVWVAPAPTVTAAEPSDSRNPVNPAGKASIAITMVSSNSTT